MSFYLDSLAIHRTPTVACFGVTWFIKRLVPVRAKTKGVKLRERASDVLQGIALCSLREGEEL